MARCCHIAYGPNNPDLELDREITRENIAALVAAGAKRVESLAPQMEILEVAGGR